MLTPREIIQRALSAVDSAFPSQSIADKVSEVALIIELLGFGDSVTTRQIVRQLITTGRV